MIRKGVTFIRRGGRIIPIINNKSGSSVKIKASLGSRKINTKKSISKSINRNRMKRAKKSLREAKVISRGIMATIDEFDAFEKSWKLMHKSKPVRKKSLVSKIGAGNLTILGLAGGFGTYMGYKRAKNK